MILAASTAEERILRTRSIVLLTRAGLSTNVDIIPGISRVFSPTLSSMVNGQAILSGVLFSIKKNASGETMSMRKMESFSGGANTTINPL